MSAIRAVLFDIGGVVQDSPLHAIACYERAHGLAANAINRAVAAAGETGAWARLERGELGLAEFYPRFEADCLAQGIRVDAPRLMAEIAAVSPRFEGDCLAARGRRPLLCRGRLEHYGPGRARPARAGVAAEVARALGAAGAAR